jgi:hypothetical protein
MAFERWGNDPGNAELVEVLWATPADLVALTAR